ncbi:hypothetical protein BCR36DRAFT_414550 [Piromyces finnis]|uniref:WD40 repeat-like protein n=1 Tax=Piromyces finnis TaxID=1754191 RepID=A0A1Y1V262_9FUNG|nr:hypothetical protein BCR36DRAFT_414550 [Piromyces finnis]|eukprot:ORX45394.1 hypothetical protein BCR36DRAFT_414550 [Piromyces finnis]
MKKETYILENSFTIPLNSEVQFEYYSNIDYLITYDEIYLCTSTRKGINTTSVALPFNSKNINEKCKNEVKIIDNMIRYKFIRIMNDDILNKQQANISNDNMDFQTKSKSLENNFIEKNYLLVFGRAISLYNPKNLEFMHQCQPQLSNQQSMLPLLYTAAASYKCFIVIGSNAGHVLLGQIKNDKIEILQITNQTYFPITDIDINDNGIIAVAFDEGEIDTYKIKDGILVPLSSHSDDNNEIITQIQIGDYILASYESGQIRLFSYNEKDIFLKCEMDLGYSEIKGMDYWNSQNIFTVIVDDFIGVWEIKKDDKIKSEFNQKMRTTTDLYKYTISDNSSESNKPNNYDNIIDTNSGTNTSLHKSDKSKDAISLNDYNEELYSLNIEMQWSYQCKSKYLSGIKFLKHLNSEAFNTDVKHNYKYIAVVAYDYSEINIYSITLTSN